MHGGLLAPNAYGATGDIRSRYDAMYALFPPLQAKRKQPAGELSGGQASRAALARALLRARPILLLDEPFAALGPALRAEMLALVRDVADATGALVLMVTHDPQDARALGGMTVFVAEGVAHTPVGTAMLLDNPTPALRDYLG